MVSKLYKRPLGLLVLALAIALGSGPDAAWAARDVEPRVVPGQVFSGGPSKQQLAEQATPRRLDPAAPIGVQMRLAPPPARLSAPVKSEPVKGFGTPLVIGSHRQLPAAFKKQMEAGDLQWEPGRDGGEVAVFSVTSPGARALRLAFDFQSLPPDAEVRFYSPSSPVAEGGSFGAAFVKAERTAGAADPFWSPVVHGDSAVVEIWVPSWRQAADVRLALREVSHIHQALAAKDLRNLGDSGGCNRDIRCFNKWTMAGNAVAKIVFEFSGGTALCTGQLMANEDLDPLFLTAAHCISTRSEAKSAVLFWMFERASCGGADPTSVIQTGGGGRLLFTSASRSAGLVTDHTLLKLNRNPPAGTTLLGWLINADPEDNLRKKIHSAHHPFGDVKKGSRGKVQELWQLRPDGTVSRADPPTHYQVGWRKGITEPGSSGGPILVGKRWPDQFVIGVLTGGLASCSARRDPDFYGMFEETFRRFRRFRKHFE